MLVPVPLWRFTRNGEEWQHPSTIEGRMRRRAIQGLVLTGSGIIAMLCVGVAAAGQAAPGDRVRLTIGTTRIVGRLDQSIGDSVVLVTDNGARHAYARAMPRRFEVSLGERSRKLQGAGVGFGVGAVAGLFVGMAADNSADQQVESDCMRGATGECIVSGGRIGDGIETVMGVVLGGVAGGLVGAIVGATKVERWRQVQARPRVAIQPRGSGALVSVRWHAGIGGRRERR